MSKRAIAPPAAPKLSLQLDDWQGEAAADVELEQCLVQDADFTDVKKLEIDNCSISAATLSGATVEKLYCSDAKLTHIEAAGLSAPEAVLLRTTVSNSRLTGADLGALQLEDCSFKAVKLDDSGLRFAVLKRVAFTDCVLRGADLTGAKLSHVTFTNCDLDGANFDHAECKSVDMRGEHVATVRGVNGLKGVRVTGEQLIELAPLMAQELGLDVDPET